MKELLRETFLGKTLRLFSGKRLLQYPEERKDFVVPEQYKLSSLSVPDTPKDHKVLSYQTQSVDEETGLKNAEAIEMRDRNEEKLGQYTIVDCQSLSLPL